VLSKGPGRGHPRRSGPGAAGAAGGVGGSKEQTDARETGLRKVREEIRLRRGLK
jgi:hypothetical protein